ncbi:unnamed protein product [Cuscuta epithymum]|uniref:Uncharacterized protein n=1 Tax=Cuscuta epithymum TaxID=186058 RepID=A0AAV0GBG7_9ASTE|nr:unnamed protein product [Cuscuta epithymum]
MFSFDSSLTRKFIHSHLHIIRIKSINNIMMKKKRVQLLLAIVAVASLSTTDGGSGSIACVAKEAIKLYAYSIRTSHVDRAKSVAMQGALTDAVSQGMSTKEATKEANKAATRAAKVATRQVDRVLGPIVSSGWDFFEVFYFGGTVTEGSLRSSGTLIGTYLVGFLGEQSFGKIGYCGGSIMGSWVGGKIGLLVYDLVNGVHHIFHNSQMKQTIHEDF